MRAFLLTVVTLGLANTLACLWAGIRGDLPQVTPTARAIDAIITAGFAAWALWLLASEVPA